MQHLRSKRLYLILMVTLLILASGLSVTMADSKQSKHSKDSEQASDSYYLSVSLNAQNHEHPLGLTRVNFSPDNSRNVLRLMIPLDPIVSASAGQSTKTDQMELNFRASPGESEETFVVTGGLDADLQSSSNHKFPFRVLHQFTTSIPLDQPVTLLTVDHPQMGTFEWKLQITHIK